MYFLSSVEVNLVDPVDDVSKEVPVYHPVYRSFEDRRNDISSITFLSARERPQIREKPRSSCAVWPEGFVLINERKKLGTSNPPVFWGPIAPSVWRLNGGRISSPLHSCFSLT